MEQRVVITDSEDVINSWLVKGWTIISTTAQHVATANSFTSIVKSQFCFVIQRSTNSL